jgi:Lon-like protease
MNHWQRLYLFGMAWAIFIFVLGELIWIPDPIRIGSWFWIDMVNLMVYLIALIPLLWIIAAIGGLRGNRSLTDWIIKVMIVVAAGSAIIFILVHARLIQYSAAFLGAAWLLICADIAHNEWKNRRGIPWSGISTFTLSIALLAGLFWPTPYMVTYPGLTVNMSRYATPEGGSQKGSIEGILVFERPAFPADWVYAWVFPHYSFERREKLGMSLGAYDSLVRDMKADANAVGSAVAFQKLGIGKGATTHGAKVIQIQSGSTVEGQWRAGDVIVEMNGKPISSTQDLTNLMKAIHPGDEVAVIIQRAGNKVATKIKTKARADNPSQAVFGIQVEDDLQLDIPRKVSFRTYIAHEGGPSHGAALALSLVDQLTPGGITNGIKVAVTGTINADGTVGQIGGIEQKAYTIERSGADVFFVPAGQEADARKGAKNLNIIPVQKLQDMIDWLKNRYPKASS